MLQSLREETQGKLQMLLSLRKNGLDSLFKEVRVFKDPDALDQTRTFACRFCLKNRESVKAEVCKRGVFEQTAPLK